MTAFTNRRLRNIALVAVVLLTAHRTCVADENGNIYIGLGAGVAQISEDFLLIDDSSTAYKALIGYDVNEYISVEGSFIAFDDIEAYFPFVDDSQLAVANGQGLNAAAILKMPLSERLKLNLRIGMLFWNTDAKAVSIDSNGNDLTFGGGLEFNVNQSMSVRLDFDAMSFGDVDANVGTAALQYRF